MAVPTVAARKAVAKKPAAPEKPKEKKTPAAALSKGSHPSTQVMVIEAVGKMNERGGSSLYAIKKYVAANYNLNVDKGTAHHIRTAIIKAVADKKLVRAKGVGASGSFKLPAKSGNVAKPKADKKPASKPAKKPAPKKTKPANKTVSAQAAAILKAAATTTTKAASKTKVTKKTKTAPKKK